jgi:hypothetical protein
MLHLTRVARAAGTASGSVREVLVLKGLRP